MYVLFRVHDLSSREYFYVKAMIQEVGVSHYYNSDSEKVRKYH